MSDRVTDSQDLVIILAPQGVDVALDWLYENDISFAMENKALVILTNAYEAWKALNGRPTSRSDIVIRAHEDLNEVEGFEMDELVRYLDARGWWVV